MPDPKAKKSKPVTTQREVIYPTIKVELCEGPKAISVDRAKKILGWTEVDAKAEGDAVHFTDMLGNKIFCSNNDANRRFDKGWSLTLAQDILNHNYKLNGETAILGKTGTVLSAQHRLCGLVFAGQMWEHGITPDGKTKEGTREHWLTKWPEEPMMETVLVTGIDESEEIKRTFDCTKPRTLTDVFYTAGLFPKGITKTQENALAKMLDYAVRFVWDRTGAKNDAYSPKRTNSEALEFVRPRHERLVRAVKAIYDDWKDVIEGTKVKQGDKMVKMRAPMWMPPFGMAAGMLYLMGASLTDGDAYWDSEEQSEKYVDFEVKVPKSQGSMAITVWDKACEFWNLLHSGHPNFKAVQRVMTALAGETGQLAGRDKQAVLTLAWGAYRDAKPLTDKAITPEYVEEKDEEGNVIGRTLKNFPLFGGIDCGGVLVDDGEDSGEQATVQAKTRTPEEIEAEKQRIREEHLAAKKGELRKAQGGGGVEAKKDEAPAPAAKPAAAADKPKTPPAPKAGTPTPAAKPATGKPPLKGGTGK